MARGLGDHGWPLACDVRSGGTGRSAGAKWAWGGHMAINRSPRWGWGEAGAANRCLARRWMVDGGRRAGGGHPQTPVDNAKSRAKTLLAVMKRHQPGQRAGTTPGGNPTGAVRFTLAQFPNHRGWGSFAGLARNRYQELLTENPANIMLSGQNGLIING